MDRKNGRRRVVQNTQGPSKTEQAHANEVDINQIMLRYSKQGILPPNRGNPRYGDFTGVSDYHSAVEAVRVAEEGFMSLPAHIRKRFRNDAGMLLAFLEDPENLAEAQELGLVEMPPPVVIGEPVASETPSEPNEKKPESVETTAKA